MSLRTRLVAALIVLSTAASLVVGFLSYRATSTQLRDEVDQSLDSTVASAAAALAGPRPRPRVLNAPSREIELQFIGPEGAVVAAEGQFEIPVEGADERLARATGRGTRLYRDQTTAGAELRVLTMSLGDGNGALQAARNLEEVNRVLASLRARILVVSLAVAAAAGLLGVLVGSSVTRRLVRLDTAARQVGDSGDLAVRVPDDGDDEVASLGSAFNEMLEALQRSRAEQQRLVQDAGHELRTPMTSLRTNLFTLRSFGDLDEGTRSAVVADLESEAAELSGLVEEVLAVAQGTTGSGPTQPVDLGELAEAQAGRAAGRWNRSVAVRVTPGLVVSGHRAQLARVVRNLVDNACKFSEPDTPVEVVVEYRPNAAGTPGVVLEVLDRGCGLVPGEEELVFARFHRSDSARAVPGSGLGLSIVADVVGAHGGVTRAANREGGGAVVSVWLPVDGLPGGSAASPPDAS